MRGVEGRPEGVPEPRVAPEQGKRDLHKGRHNNQPASLNRHSVDARARELAHPPDEPKGNPDEQRPGGRCAAVEKGRELQVKHKKHNCQQQHATEERGGGQAWGGAGEAERAFLGFHGGATNML